MRNVTSHYSPNLKNFEIKSSSSILMLNILISYFHWILKDRVRTTYATAGRDGNRNSWKITKPQVNPIDAHKNKNICMVKKCFVSKMPLENAKIGSARPL